MGKTQGRVDHVCLACRRAQKRRHQKGLGHQDRLLSEAPDPEPARYLRELLAEARVRGLSFDAAWHGTEEEIGAVEWVLANVADEQDRDQWRRAFHSTRTGWRSAFNGWPGPGQRLTPALLDVLQAGEGRVLHPGQV
jgi:hypothetical protein